MTRASKSIYLREYQYTYHYYYYKYCQLFNSPKRDDYISPLDSSFERYFCMAAIPKALKGEKTWKRSNNFDVLNMCCIPVLQNEKYQICAAKVRLMTERFCFQPFKMPRNNSFHSRLRKAKWCIPYMHHE